MPQNAVSRFDQRFLKEALIESGVNRRRLVLQKQLLQSQDGLIFEKGSEFMILGK